VRDDTQIGGPCSRFPATQRTVILACRSGERAERARAFEKIASVYWKPIYKLIRLRWSLTNDDAKDLTQAFFVRALEKGFFKDYRPEKGSFRTFLRTCAMRFVVNESRHAQRIKRGGNISSVPLDAVGEQESETLSDFFEKEWIRSVFSIAVDDLRKTCVESRKTIHFQMFERYNLEEEKLSYGDLATEYGLAVTDVTNYLAWCRREFRRLLLQHIRDLTANDADFRREARLVLGGKP
jgi:RNA polymerase sigma factor (sigma-70 family)